MFHCSLYINSILSFRLQYYLKTEDFKGKKKSQSVEKLILIVYLPVK